jgi:hypothetical protein
MREVYGDMWDLAPQYEAVCVLVNWERRFDQKTDAEHRRPLAIMGRGCAAEALKRYPGLDARFGQIIDTHQKPYVTTIWDQPQLIAFPTKESWRLMSAPSLIEQSARQLRTLIDHQHLQSVLLPRPGTGAGRLQWRNVRTLLAPLLDDRVSIVSFAAHDPKA